MDIELTIKVTLEDSHWGFSDLLNGEKLEDMEREVKDLLLEDMSFIYESAHSWKLREVTKPTKSKMVGIACKEGKVFSSIISNYIDAEWEAEVEYYKNQGCYVMYADALNLYGSCACNHCKMLIHEFNY
jgi:hypothetical protein